MNYDALAVYSSSIRMKEGSYISPYGCYEMENGMIQHSVNCISKVHKGDRLEGRFGHCHIKNLRLVGREIWFNEDNWMEQKERINQNEDRIKMMEMWMELTDGLQREVKELKGKIDQLEKELESFKK